nr:ATP-binding protein [Desulfonispora thiosulfatigenes]
MLVRRVLNNMVKNAVEASDDEPVTIEVLSELNDIIFKVHNCQYISRDIQLQIFKRSFSTKEKGQGIGTYSMKLLGEKYLAGEVSFSTEKRLGTTFTFRLSNVKRNDIFADNGNK